MQDESLLEIKKLKTELLKYRLKIIHLQDNHDTVSEHEYRNLVGKDSIIFDKLSEINKFYTWSIKDLISAYVKFKYRRKDQKNGLNGGLWYHHWSNLFDSCRRTNDLYDDAKEWIQTNHDEFNEIVKNNSEYIDKTELNYKNLWDKCILICNKLRVNNIISFTELQLNKHVFQWIIRNLLNN